MESQSEQPRVITEVYSSQKKVNQGLMEAIHSQRNLRNKPLERHGALSSRRVIEIRIEQLEEAHNTLSKKYRAVSDKLMAQNFVILALFFLVLVSFMW